MPVLTSSKSFSNNTGLRGRLQALRRAQRRIYMSRLRRQVLQTVINTSIDCWHMEQCRNIGQKIQQQLSLKKNATGNIGKKRNGSRKGCKTRTRVRRSVEQIYEALGPTYFRRAYRMSYESFCTLHKKLLPYIIKAAGYPDYENTFYIHNGEITSSVRLACAIRYFAGGSPYDIMCKYGIGHGDVLGSVWIVVNAINMNPDFSISYPESEEEQKKIAQGFQNISSGGFDCCAGAVDGILIWTHRPSLADCEKTGCDPMKFMCGRKQKYGLNCQAISDARGRFLDISIIFPGSTSDCLAFEGSSLYKKLEDGILAHGLCLFGDNAYINTFFMATPYTGQTSLWDDSYNFHHSQLRIRVECAFGMFVQRWGLLRSAIPKGISISRTTALVVALAKLHNFCIDETGNSIPRVLAVDEHNIENNGDVGAVSLERVEHAGSQGVPLGLLHGGHHFDDIGNRGNERRRQQRQFSNSVLPRERLRDIIADQNLERPVPIPRRH